MTDDEERKGLAKGQMTEWIRWAKSDADVPVEKAWNSGKKEMRAGEKILRVRVKGGAEFCDWLNRGSREEKKNRLKTRRGRGDSGSESNKQSHPFEKGNWSKGGL